MSTLNAQVLTLLDWAKRLGPDGSVASSIAELLHQTNEMLEDLLFVQGNLPTGHRTVIRTGLPTVYWRLLNQGVAVSKSRTAQVDEQCGMLEAWGEVDIDLAKLAADLPAFRLSEAKPFLEAMNQEMQQTVLYGNAGTAPEEFTGLSTRYSSLSAENGQNIISGSGSGSDNTSIWLIQWGEHGVHGIFPKGSQAGLMHEDLGQQTIETTAGVAGSRMRVYQDRYQWKNGLVVKDWRYAVRIPNIDVSNLVGESSAADLIKLMSRAIDRIPSWGMGRSAFYCNRTVRSMLRIQALGKSSSALSATEALDQFGNPIRNNLFFFGIPIRLCDQILNTEAAVA